MVNVLENDFYFSNHIIREKVRKMTEMTKVIKSNEISKMRNSGPVADLTFLNVV